MRIFISGIMQGSRTDTKIVAQDYRREFTQLLERYFSDVEIIDPIELHPNSVTYSPEQAKRTLLELVEMAGEVDVLVAYVPSASMGTAVEMWQAYRADVPIYTISPLAANWVVRSLSEQVFPDIESFHAFVAGGGLARA